MAAPLVTPERPLPRLLRPREVAERLGISRAAAYKLLYTKQLDTIRIGKSVRIDASDFERFVEARRAGSDGEPTAA